MHISELLEIKTREYKNKTFDELLQLVDKVQCFTGKAQGRSYDLEVHVEQRERDKLYIMIEAARNYLFLSLSSRQVYFTMQRDGTIKDISGDEYWS
jgi:hypothetical protein